MAALTAQAPHVAAPRGGPRRSPASSSMARPAVWLVAILAALAVAALLPRHAALAASNEAPSSGGDAPAEAPHSEEPGEAFLVPVVNPNSYRSVIEITWVKEVVEACRHAVPTCYWGARIDDIRPEAPPGSALLLKSLTTAERLLRCLISSWDEVSQHHLCSTAMNDGHQMLLKQLCRSTVPECFGDGSETDSILCLRSNWDRARLANGCAEAVVVHASHTHGHEHITPAATGSMPLRPATNEARIIPEAVDVAVHDAITDACNWLFPECVGNVNPGNDIVLSCIRLLWYNVTQDANTRCHDTVTKYYDLQLSVQAHQRVRTACLPSVPDCSPKTEHEFLACVEFLQWSASEHCLRVLASEQALIPNVENGLVMTVRLGSKPNSARVPQRSLNVVEARMALNGTSVLRASIMRDKAAASAAAASPSLKRPWKSASTARKQVPPKTDLRVDLLGNVVSAATFAAETVMETMTTLEAVPQQPPAEDTPAPQPVEAVKTGNLRASPASEEVAPVAPAAPATPVAPAAPAAATAPAAPAPVTNDAPAATAEEDAKSSKTKAPKRKVAKKTK